MPAREVSAGMKALPASLATRRLLLRPPQVADAAAINEAIRESFTELHAWMEWAVTVPTVAESRAFCETAVHQRQEGSACPMLMLDAASGLLVGASGYARIDWAVPSFEIGYWCRTPMCGRGYASEAADALARHAFTELGANRVEVRMDERNVRSAAVAERLGFELEGVIRHHVRDHHGNLRNTRVYALLDAARLSQPR